MATMVRDVMTHGVETATPSQMLQEAAQMMRTGDFGSIPVVDGGQLVAVLTDRDIVVRAVAEGLDPTTVQVGQVASPDPVTIAPEQDLDDALEITRCDDFPSSSRGCSSGFSARPTSHSRRKRRRWARSSRRSRSLPPDPASSRRSAQA